MIHIIFAFLIKCCRFVETTFFRRFINSSFRAFFHSNYCVFQNRNEWKSHCCWNIFRSHRVKHEFCFHHVFNFSFFRLFFKTLIIECFIKSFAGAAPSFCYILLMRTFCETMLLRIMCAALFIFARICSMIIILTFYALFSSAISFVIFHCFYVWFHDYFQLNQFIRDFYVAHSHHH